MVTGLNWQIMQHIDSGGSAYSALTALNDTHAGLVYESGAYSALTFRTIRLKTDDVLKTAASSGTVLSAQLNPAVSDHPLSTVEVDQSTIPSATTWFKIRPVNHVQPDKSICNRA